ncbi:MAG: nucleotidyltransferase family protein, partial [Clostridia bacterium]|nr:nucleotidyltransferase family protein [Clostridia bacterium]
VICEYNPFHNGHLRQISQIRKTFGECGIISIMSGNYVQRGEPAILGKYERAGLAVDNGADLVLELIPPYCFAPAEIFARAGVYIAVSVGADALAFGSETGDIAQLRSVSENLRSDIFAAAFDTAVKENTHGERSYIKIRSDVYRGLFGEELPGGPNDILALEYIAAADKYGLDLCAFRREDGFSATQAREAFDSCDNEILGSTVPDNVLQALSDRRGRIAERNRVFETMIMHRLLTLTADEMSGFEDCPYSLAARLTESADESRGVGETLARACTNKYTYARIKRVLLNCLCSVKKGAYGKLPEYTHLLAANAAGRRYLREIAGKTGIPIVTKPADGELSGIALTADRLYAFASGKTASDAVKDKPFIL